MTSATKNDAGLRRASISSAERREGKIGGGMDLRRDRAGHAVVVDAEVPQDTRTTPRTAAARWRETARRRACGPAAAPRAARRRSNAKAACSARSPRVIASGAPVEHRAAHLARRYGAAHRSRRRSSSRFGPPARTTNTMSSANSANGRIVVIGERRAAVDDDEIDVRTDQLSGDLLRVRDCGFRRASCCRAAGRRARCRCR